MKGDLRTLTGKINGKNRIKHKTQTDIDYINDLNLQKRTLMKYKSVLNDYFTSNKYIKSGQGIFYFNKPHQPLDRLENSVVQFLLEIME